MRRKMHLLRYILSVACLPVLLYGQTNTENFAQLEFNFNNPGARAAALGGAFVSIADDATAAEANPAGLTNMLQPEISFEMKRIHYTRNIFNYSWAGDISNVRLVGRDFEDWIISPSFASVVFPFNDKNITISAFRHELVNFISQYNTTGAVIPGLPHTPDDTKIFYPVLRSKTEIKVANWGAAIGYKIKENISIGAALGLSNLSVSSFLERFVTDATYNLQYIINDNAIDYFFNIGIIYRPSDKMSVGATFKKRPSFEIPQTVRTVERSDPQNRTTIANNKPNFNIPSAFGAGVSYQPTDLLTIGFDVVRVTYSDLTRDFVITDSEGEVFENEFKSYDAIDVHLGAEYVTFWKNKGVVFRSGFYTEQDNSIEYTGRATDNVTYQAQRLSFSGGDADTHFTLGAGLLLNQNWQFDVAADFSRDTDDFIGSLVFRF